MDFYETLNRIVLPVNRKQTLYSEALRKQIIKAGELLSQFSDDNFSAEFHQKLKNIVAEGYTNLNPLILCAEKIEEKNFERAKALLFKYLNAIKRFQLNFENRAFSSGLYRIRSNEKEFTSRREMFHCPWTEKEKIKESRFSGLKEPCLYLSTSPHVAWLECQMPAEYWISRFWQTQVAIGCNLLFLIKPREILMNIYSQASHLNFPQKQEKCLLDYFEQLPLIIACSFIVSETKIEYRIPQMLMEWIKENKSETNIIGLAYYSDSAYANFQYYNGFNLALPVCNYANNGYDEFLQKAFKLTKPKKIEILVAINEVIGEIDAYLETYWMVANKLCFKNIRIFNNMARDLLGVKAILENKFNRKEGNVEELFIILRMVIDNMDNIIMTGFYDAEKQPIETMTNVANTLSWHLNTFFNTIFNPNVVDGASEKDIEKQFDVIEK